MGTPSLRLYLESWLLVWPRPPPVDDASHLRTSGSESSALMSKRLLVVAANISLAVALGLMIIGFLGLAIHGLKPFPLVLFATVWASS